MWKSLVDGERIDGTNPEFGIFWILHTLFEHWGKLDAEKILFLFLAKKLKITDFYKEDNIWKKMKVFSIQ